MDENNVTKSEISNKKNKVNMIICIIIALLVGGCCGFFISQSIKSNKDESKKEEKENIENEKENNEINLNKIEGKHSFSDYCPNTGSCKKNIGKISLNNQELNFSVDLENINTESVSGNISLGSNTKNVSDFTYYHSGLSLDGFEIYQDYLILYTSKLEKEKQANCQELEGLRGYYVYIFDSNLNEVAGLAGYTLNNGFTDFKIEDGYVYYYGELATGDAVEYSKISFNDLLQKNWEGNITISNVRECK